MNFFADESVDNPVVERLRRDGHLVIYIAEVSPSVEDDEVLVRANSAAALLITADKDFGELVYRQRRVHAGVILLRLAGLSPLAKTEMVSTAIREHGAEFVGAFSVVSAGMVRIRRSV